MSLATAFIALAGLEGGWRRLCSAFVLAERRGDVQRPAIEVGMKRTAGLVHCDSQIWETGCRSASQALWDQASTSTLQTRCPGHGRLEKYVWRVVERHSGSTGGAKAVTVQQNAGNRNGQGRHLGGNADSDGQDPRCSSNPVSAVQRTIPPSPTEAQSVSSQPVTSIASMSLACISLATTQAQATVSSFGQLRAYPA